MQDIIDYYEDRETDTMGLAQEAFVLEIDIAELYGVKVLYRM